MDKKAKYREHPVYVVFVSRDITYALISHNQDKSRAFKVDLKDLTDLNFVPKKQEEDGLPT
jgi:hypothetical protein